MIVDREIRLVVMNTEIFTRNVDTTVLSRQVFCFRDRFGVEDRAIDCSLVALSIRFIIQSWAFLSFKYFL